jgi:hypothetical protein
MGLEEIGSPVRARTRADETAASDEAIGLSTRHLTFGAGAFEVEMRIRADEIRRTASIAGVVREGNGRAVLPSRLQVWLTSPGAEIASVPLSRRGLFTARQVTGGRQVLEVVVDCEECHRLCFFV